ncbi:MAG: hypothetical protein KAT65_09215 [Methanophagales archaeon]|nr:hypothetical protein [Methanophagales archaeon]
MYYFKNKTVKKVENVEIYLASIDDLIKTKEVKGFSYTLEDEKIIEYMKLSTKDKLKWLEEINEFMDMVLNPKEKELRAKLRRCEI